MPSRSITPGPMFSTTTSACFTSSSNMARPRGDLRLRVTPFLQEFRRMKNHASSPRLPRLRGVRGEAYGLRPRLVVGDHVDHGGLARGIGALQGGANVVRLLHEFTMRAQVLGELVVTRVTEVAPGLGQRARPRRVGRPAAVVA